MQFCIYTAILHIYIILNQYVFKTKDLLSDIIKCNNYDFNTLILFKDIEKYVETNYYDIKPNTSFDSFKKVAIENYQERYKNLMQNYDNKIKYLRSLYS